MEDIPVDVPPNENIGGCIPGIPGWVDASGRRLRSARRWPAVTAPYHPTSRWATTTQALQNTRGGALEHAVSDEFFASHFVTGVRTLRSDYCGQARTQTSELGDCVSLEVF